MFKIIRASFENQIGSLLCKADNKFVELSSFDASWELRAL